MTETLENRIIRHEGMRLIVYSDSLGYPTIGVGHLLSNGISMGAAMHILDDDIQAAQKALVHECPWAVNTDQVRRDVLVEMVFQLGINRFMMFQKMLTACQLHDYATAAQEMLNSGWHKQTPSRCEELANLMLHGG